MWLISLRDLQYRYRRFLIAIAVTALVFGIAVAIAIDGIEQTLQKEPAAVVSSFDADTWAVRRGSSGLFTTNAVLPDSVVGALRARGGL
jgi:hypothetical protein